MTNIPRLNADNIFFIFIDLQDKLLSHISDAHRIVARNELLQHWRRQEPPDWMVAFEPLSRTLAEQRSAPMQVDEVSQFAEWMTFLEPAERELVRLRFVEELSYEELALVLDAPLGTVKWRLFSVRKKLSHIISRTSGDGVREYPRKQEL